MVTPAIESPKPDISPMLMPGWICLILGLLTFWVFGFGFILLMAAAVMAIISLYAHRATGMILLVCSLSSIVLCSVLFFFLIFFAGFYLMVHSMHERVRSDLGMSLRSFPYNGPKNAVDHFYTAYIRHASAHPSAASRSTFVRARHAAFTPEFLKAYDASLKNSPQDYDPILQSNHLPSALKATNTDITNKIAHVFLHDPELIDDKPTLDVRLQRQGGKWLIDAIGDLNGTPKTP